MTQLVEIHGAGEGEDLRAQVELVNVHVDLAEHRPMPIPAVVRDVFEAFDACARGFVTSHN
jgi:acyl-CoA thioesterase FadM